MRLADGRYECTLCGAILDVPAEMTEAVEAAELADCLIDAIVLEGVEIHRCGVILGERPGLLSLS
jgi:hypothetical protein